MHRGKYATTKPSSKVLDQILEAVQSGSSATAMLNKLNVNRGHFWYWITHKATPAQKQRYVHAVKARAHAMVDETVDIADRAKDRDQALCAKIQIEARWRAAGKYDPANFGDDYLPQHIQNVAIIDDALLKRVQERHITSLREPAKDSKQTAHANTVDAQKPLLLTNHQ
jgi:Bacteriophage Sf6, terminase small subunit-like